MSDNDLPAPHRDPLLDLLRPYITRSAEELRERGVELHAAWLDPSGPRDATIVCRLKEETYGLVWDEETGWRLGGFVSGRQGERTRLADARYLGGDVLLDPAEMARRVIEGETGPHRKFRDHFEDPEGFDAKVRAAYTG
jgi:hypothetical protein